MKPLFPDFRQVSSIVKATVAVLALVLAGSTLHAQIYVTTSVSEILEYNFDGSLARTINGVESSASAFAVSGSDLYVENPSSGIEEYTTSGTLINSSLIPPQGQDETVAVSGTDVFVGTSIPNFGISQEDVAEYTTSGTVVSAHLIEDNTGFIPVSGLAVSGTDLFVMDESGNIGEYTTSGSVVNASLIQGQSVAPNCMVVSGSDIFVAEHIGAYGGFISEFSTSGALINQDLVSGISFPLGMCLSGSDLFVTEASISNYFIAEYDTSGRTINNDIVTSAGGLQYLTPVVIPQPVPEPSTWAMIAVGLGALVPVRKRTRILAKPI